MQDSSIYTDDTSNDAENVKTTVEYRLKESIYDYALVALMNPREMEDWPNDPQYLQPIMMTRRMRSSIF